MEIKIAAGGGQRIPLYLIEDSTSAWSTLMWSAVLCACVCQGKEGKCEMYVDIDTKDFLCYIHRYIFHCSRVCNIVILLLLYAVCICYDMISVDFFFFFFNLCQT